jgi:hypothetical protein
MFRLPEGKNNTNNSYHFKSIDTSRYAILKFNSKSNYYFDKDVKATTLTTEEIQKIENLIDDRISRYNKVQEVAYQKYSTEIKKKHLNSIALDNRIKKPEKYYKQLIAVINSKGEKLVWVNCFCTVENLGYWRKSEVMVDDGGSCYFNLKINLTKGITYDFMVNGVA